MLLYANEDDLYPWVGLNALPDNTLRLLRFASSMVRHATRGAIYDTLDDLPTDTATRQALTDATCAQVAMWISADIDPGAAGVGSSAPGVASRSTTVPGATVSESFSDLSTSVTVQQARAEATGKLCAEAVMILGNAGLLNGQPW